MQSYELRLIYNRILLSALFQFKNGIERGKHILNSQDNEIIQ